MLGSLTGGVAAAGGVLGVGALTILPILDKIINPNPQGYFKEISL